LEKAFWQFDYGQLKLVFHALEECAHILQNAPQLCNALPTMTPCYEWWEIPYYWAGLKLYDLVAGSHMLYMSGYFLKKEAMETFPTLAQQNAL
jgi:glycerol-3-phosphate dehydrogenase